MKLLHRVREFNQFPNKWELTKLLHEVFSLDIMKEEERWKIVVEGKTWQVMPNERLNDSPRFVFENYLPALLLKILLEKELLNLHGRQYPYGRNQAKKTYARLRGQTPGEDDLPEDCFSEAGWSEGNSTGWEGFEQELEADSK